MKSKILNVQFGTKDKIKSIYLNMIRQIVYLFSFFHFHFLFYFYTKYLLYEIV